MNAPVQEVQGCTHRPRRIEHDDVHWQDVMQSDWREFSGFGDLLCLALAWAIGLGAVWADYATRDNRVTDVRVAEGPARNTGSQAD